MEALTSHRMAVLIEAAKQKRLDPKAKIRNRGTVVFPAASKKIKDDKDHFPINNASQARNALSRVAQFSAAPPWYAGSLKELQTAVRNAVSRKFKDIQVTKPKATSGPNFSENVNSFKEPQKPRTQPCKKGYKLDKTGKKCVKA